MPRSRRRARRSPRSALIRPHDSRILIASAALGAGTEQLRVHRKENVGRSALFDALHDFGCPPSIRPSMVFCVTDLRRTNDDLFDEGFAERGRDAGSGWLL